jgi:hypothetical protein
MSKHARKSDLGAIEHVAVPEACRSNSGLFINAEKGTSMSKLPIYCGGMASVLAMGSAPALADGTLGAAISETKPMFNIRLRYEGVEQDGFANDADALTARIRAGFETGAFANTKFLVDFEHIEALNDDYNSTINGNTGFPVVADPEGTELNRLQFTNTSLENTTITVGRQRIIHDDARFVGNVGWRQNEQTFDAVRVVTKPVEGFKIDLAYVDQVNRIFGDDSPNGRWDSSSLLADVDFTLSDVVTLSGFAYWLDFEDDAAALHSQTYGVMVSAKQGPLSGRFRYAMQSDYADQPTEYDASYYNIEGKWAENGLAFTLGYEVLGSDDGVKAFATPLATLHKFNGFADVFLGTPADGLQDLYASAAYTVGDIGPASGVKFVAGYHDYSADEGGADYGSEVSLVASAKFGKTGALVKFSDYDADEFAGDRTKLWVQLSWGF